MKKVTYKGKEVRISPLLMKPELVAQTIRGIKTETRRLNGLDEVNLNPDEWLLNPKVYTESGVSNPRNRICFHNKENNKNVIWVTIPYGQVGDIIWVRETWAELNQDGVKDPIYVFKSSKYINVWWKWKPNIHMPFSACGIFLEIQSVTLERLQDISDEGAIAEGIETVNQSATQLIENGVMYRKYIEKGFFQDGTRNPIISYCTLWNSINGPESWNKNPWVWVIKYCQVNKSDLTF